MNRTRHQIPSQPHPQKTRKDKAPQRINRILSLAGLTSRRKADEWIRSARVKINGSVVTQPGTKAVWGVDTIIVDGKEIPQPFERIYLMLNKPFGTLSSLRDPTDRPLATEFLKGVSTRVYPVGRLDFDSLGLLPFTNDGELAYRLTHPRFRVPRTYKATVRGRITEKALDNLRHGVRIRSGALIKATDASLLAQSSSQSTVRLTILQGIPRQVRRMLRAVGFDVIHLIRTHFGTLELGDLKVGEYRYLEKEEVESLKRLVDLY